MVLTTCTTAPRPGFNRKSDALIVATGAAILCLTLLHVLRRDVDPTWVFISDYMLGDWGWLMRLAFAAMALALGVSAAIMAAFLRGWARWIVSGLLGLAASGMLIAGIFPPDPTGTPLEALTGTGTLHMIGASLDFTPVAALIGSIILAKRSGWRGNALWLLAASILTCAAMVAFIVSMPPDHVFGPETHTGLVGRLQWASYFTWFAALAFMSRRKNAESCRTEKGAER